jgi:UDP-galactopyranose mutase
MAGRESNIFFGGRLAEYRYYDMDQVIASALTRVKQISQNRFPM